MDANLLNLLGNVVQTQTAAADGAGGGILGMLVPFVLIFVIFYFLVIMPQKKQQKKHLEMINSLQKGDSVVTTGGIYGKIAEIKEKTMKLEISSNPRVVITVQRSILAGKAADDESSETAK